MPEKNKLNYYDRVRFVHAWLYHQLINFAPHRLVMHGVLAHALANKSQEIIKNLDRMDHFKIRDHKERKKLRQIATKLKSMADTVITENSHPLLSKPPLGYINDLINWMETNKMAPAGDPGGMWKWK